MFQTDLLSIIRGLSTVYTAVDICHASYVDSLLATSGWNCAFQNFGNAPTNLKIFVFYTSIL